MAYMLGHVDPIAALRSAEANLNPGGKLVVYDVFDGTPRFDSELAYTSPKLATFGGSRPRTVSQIGGIPLSEFIATSKPWIAREVTPALLVFQ
jgi:hypothetical protein